VDLRILPTESDVARALAERVASALREKPALVLGLPTGRTPLAMYGELRRMYPSLVDFSRASTFNLDEFVGVASSDSGSFRDYMERHLFDGVNVDPSRIYFLNGMAADLEAECERFELAIETAGGIDLQVLGIGANGHIGFNEPADALVARTHRVTLHEGTRRDNADLFGGDTQRVPHEALSMGVGTILHATRVILIATGARKARCVERMIHGPLTTRMPASFLQTHRYVEVYLDREAASLLPD
jgi:glucosamine-6-phosphate deaminase